MFAQKVVSSFVVAAAMLLAVCGVAQAQATQGRVEGTVQLRGVPPNVNVMFEIDGTKPPGSDTVASTEGIAQMVLNYSNTPKPEGFKATVYVDICRNGVRVRIVSNGTVPPSDPDCDRRSFKNVDLRPDSLAALDVGQPLSPFPNAFLGGGFSSDSGPMNFASNLEVHGGQIGNTTIPDERNTEVPRNQRIDGQMSGQQTTFMVPAGSFGGHSRPNAMRWMAPETAADSAGSSRLISHHAIVGIGRGQAELDYIITDGSSPNVRWKGSNTLWSLGYGAAIELCDGCRWFANTSYVYSRLQKANMERSITLDLEGGTLLRDDVSYEWNGHTVAATVGRATSHVFPYAGVRIARRSASLEGKLDVDFSAVVGRTAILNASFVNEFNKTSAQAIFGAQARIPNTRLILRAEGAAGSGTTAFGVNLGYGWY